MLVEKWLPFRFALVRAMSNTPATVLAAATGLFANDGVSAQQKSDVESVFRAVGLTLWLQEEKLMRFVTATSGCGPAYYFLIMEAMQQAAEQMGLPAEMAQLLTKQTALGAARLAVETEQDPAALRSLVTSPNTPAIIPAANAGSAARTNFKRPVKLASLNGFVNSDLASTNAS